jgi:hypothetical protein
VSEVSELVPYGHIGTRRVRDLEYVRCTFRRNQSAFVTHQPREVEGPQCMSQHRVVRHAAELQRDRRRRFDGGLFKSFFIKQHVDA